MATVDPWLVNFIKRWEGGLSSSTADTGALAQGTAPGTAYHTSRGVLWSTFQSIAPRCGIPVTTERFIALSGSSEQAARDWMCIFEKGFWQAGRLSEIKSQGVANFIADWMWGSGPGGSIARIQRHLGLPVDSVMGPATLGAINRQDPAAFIDWMYRDRMAFLRSLPQWTTFGTGWSNRVNELYADAKKKPAADCGCPPPA